MNDYDFKKIVSSIMDQFGDRIEEMENVQAIINYTFFFKTST